MNFLIRPEVPADHAAIDEITRLAFGGEQEVILIRAIRAAAGFDPELSLVAAAAGRVLGHILFSPIRIESPRGDTAALALAPMAVHPDVQRRGIGSRLVVAGLDACRRRDHGIVIVVGHPDFYARAGFVPADAYGMRPPFPVPDQAFRALLLRQPADPQTLRGTVRYPAAFDGA